MDKSVNQAPIKRQITLKLHTLSGAPSTSLTASATPAPDVDGVVNIAAAPSVPQTPLGSASTKIKLVRKSVPSTPAESISSAVHILPPKMTKITKAGRALKPTKKKREHVEMESDEDTPMSQNKRLAHGNGFGMLSPPAPPLDPSAAAIHQQQHTLSKKIKVLPKTPKTPIVKIRQRREHRPPPRPLGDGYDSEAEDRELDPVIEEQFILRMYPGEHCDYLRQAIEERKIGVPVKQGGADIQIKWLDDEVRRACITVQGQPYAAVMVDLPTITESMKTWDKKSLVKSADICQMLLVFAPVQNEEEAKTIDFPKPVEPGWRWPHGLTPPMHDCRNRRFRKRLSKLEIQNKEAEVERLLAADKAAVSTKITWVDEDEDEEVNHVRTGPGGQDVVDEDEDLAEGEYEDCFGDGTVGDPHVVMDNLFGDDDVNDDELEAEFEAAPDTPFDLDANQVPVASGSAEVFTPATAQAGSTSTGESVPEAGMDDEEDEDDEEEDDDGDEGDVDNDGDDDNHDEVAGVRGEIAALKKQLAKCQEDLAKSSAVLMRKRLEDRVRNIKAEIALKKSSINELDED